jgi:lysozyme
MNNSKLTTSNKGIELIKLFEGFSATSYICSGGKCTIGYGHVILDHEKYSTISENEAEEVLRMDLQRAERVILRNIEPPLLQHQFDSLVSLVFNIGGAAFQRSTLRQKINSLQGLEDISREFTRWVYAGGALVKGLIKRRAAEAMLYSANEYALI